MVKAGRHQLIIFFTLNCLLFHVDCDMTALEKKEKKLQLACVIEVKLDQRVLVEDMGMGYV